MTNIIKTSQDSFKHRHLLGIDGLSREDAYVIMELAKNYILKNRQPDKKHAILKGRTLINLFFENSTRTRTSFELACKSFSTRVTRSCCSLSISGVIPSFPRIVCTIDS